MEWTCLPVGFIRSMAVVSVYAWHISVYKWYSNVLYRGSRDMIEFADLQDARNARRTHASIGRDAMAAIDQVD